MYIKANSIKIHIYIKFKFPVAKLEYFESNFIVNLVPNPSAEPKKFPADKTYEVQGVSKITKYRVSQK